MTYNLNHPARHWAIFEGFYEAFSDLYFVPFGSCKEGNLLRIQRAAGFYFD